MPGTSSKWEIMLKIGEGTTEVDAIGFVTDAHR